MPIRFAAILIALLPLAALAQDQSAELVFDSVALEVGEAVDGQLVLTNLGEPALPTLVAPPGLELQITNPRPSQSSQMSVINGRRSQRITYVYALRLTAKKEGVHSLGPFTVTSGGAAHRTNALNITVKPATAASRALGDQYLFAKIDVTQTALYVTQSFTATLTIGVRKLEIDGRLTEVGSLLQFIDGRASELSRFGTNFSSSEMTLSDSTGTKHPYMIYRNSVEIRGEQVGTLTVGPVFLKMNYPTQLSRGVFGGVEASKSRKETARAAAIDLEVKGPPEQGRPADYTAAIGQYKFRIDVKPNRVELGRPFTLSLTITGTPLDGVAGPQLSRYSELVSRFDFAADELTGDVEGGAKVFRRAIFPKQQGEQTIPSLSWSYFDPTSEKYITLTSDPIPVIIDPPPAGASPTMVELPHAGTENNKNGLTVLTGGIAPNYVDATAVLADHSLSLQAAPTAGLLLGPPLVWLSVVLVTRHRRRLTSDIGFRRGRSARRTALSRMDAALRQTNPADQWSGLAHALTGFLCDRLNLPPGERTPAEVRDLLHERGTVDPLADEIVGFLQSCDAVRYAPGAVGSTSPAQMVSKLRVWLDAIERSAR